MTGQELLFTLTPIVDELQNIADSLYTMIEYPSSASIRATQAHIHRIATELDSLTSPTIRSED